MCVTKVAIVVALTLYIRSSCGLPKGGGGGGVVNMVKLSQVKATICWPLS